MKEHVFYDQKNDCIWLAMKDQKTMVNRKWHQQWWISNGAVAMRPDTTAKAEKLTRGMVPLELPYIWTSTDKFQIILAANRRNHDQ